MINIETLILVFFFGIFGIILLSGRNPVDPSGRKATGKVLAFYRISGAILASVAVVLLLNPDIIPNILESMS